jgi:CheY-like chemotaxis protein
MGRRPILVVDDDAAVRTIACLILSAEGYTAVAAADGIEALERMRGDPPALVFIDLTMPRMDGEELMRKMKQDSTLAKIPVAVMSGRTSLRSLTLPARVVARLSKPVELDELLSVVQQAVL